MSRKRTRKNVHAVELGRLGGLATAKKRRAKRRKRGQGKAGQLSLF